jgi:hypothetical protein
MNAGACWEPPLDTLKLIVTIVLVILLVVLAA